MNLKSVLAQLNDLPATFQPAGNPYAQIVTALGTAESLYTLGADSTLTQVLAFTNALDGWIDVWGLLFGVPRYQNEGNIPYATRITETVLAWVGTLPAIQTWINLFAPGSSVTENTPGPGYAISVPATMTTQQVSNFLQSLNRIRPAGVPFTLQQKTPGLFLGTEAFLGRGESIGAWIGTGMTTGVNPLNATTCSSQPLIPDLFLVDPYLAVPGLLSQALQGTWPPSTATAQA